jgi:transposase
MEVKKEQIALLEQQSELGNIDLFYGDETGVSELAYVPYGWQQKNENLAIPAQHGSQLNCFGILSRTNQFFSKTSINAINADFIIDFLEEFSFKIQKQTVIILDNARVHSAKKVKERFVFWQKRGLYIFYLPPYSPHLNIIERLWKELKARWLKPEDYISFDDLQYATLNCFDRIGFDLNIKFSKYCQLNYS